MNLNRIVKENLVLLTGACHVVSIVAHLSDLQLRGNSSFTGLIDSIQWFLNVE